MTDKENPLLRIRRELQNESTIGFQPTIIARDQWLRSVSSVTSFLGTSALAVGALVLLASTPAIMVGLATRRLYRRSVCGRTLDLVPRPSDTRILNLLRMSRATRVEVIVNTRERDFFSGPALEMPAEDASSEQKQQYLDASRDATLCHTERFNPMWFDNGRFEFATALRADVTKPDAPKYDTVLLHSALCVASPVEARALLREATRFVVPDEGRVVVCDFGEPSADWLRRLLRWVHQVGRTDLFLTHPIVPWAVEQGLELVACHRSLFGAHYCAVFKKPSKQ